ncbi:hypothetical protein [Streptomyces sp. NPDC059176]|uniref:hypothetical protein n=1 Tax=Streptomyces sp. NPDC059176 TaxID=3346758 RepID=UPI003677B35F
MAGQRFFGRGAGRRAASLAAAGLLLAVGCARPAPDTTARDIGRTLDARAAAVLRHDEAGYLAALDPKAGRLRETDRREFENLADVPLSSWEYRLGQVRRSGHRATAQAELRYRIDGYDKAPVTEDRTLELAERNGRWYVTADRAVRDRTQQLWQQGDVDVVRGAHSLVLGVGQDRARLGEIAAAADRAVPAVSAAWGEAWAGRVVVLVPASLDGMGRLLGAPAAGYRGIAAVTTGETGAGAQTPADRVIVNPEAYEVLGPAGRHTVLTHETAHVATRAHTSKATPMWLSEGFADWAAYRSTGTAAAEAAPELQRAVRQGKVPDGLPVDADFRFGGSADALGHAYEGGWLACELIAERWGEDRLRAFYRAVGDAEQRAGAEGKALHDVLGTTTEEFTAAWRGFLRERLG